MTGDRRYSEALTALREGRTDEAVALLRRGAEAGDADCQAVLGGMYLDGHGPVARDPAEGRRLLECSVVQGNPDGTYVYGVALYEGRHLSRDAKKGLHLVKRAALMGLADAQMFVAGHYRRRFFHRRKASAWVLVAAEHGHPEARAFVEQRGAAPRDVQQMAAQLSGTIAILKTLLQGADAETALRHLDQLASEV